MVKKIFILLIFLFNLVFVNTSLNSVFANSTTDVSKPIIVLEGYDYSKYLEYPGFSIISSTVNFNKSGNYKIVYENNLDKTTVEKEVYVKTKDELTKSELLNQSFTSLYSLDERSILNNIKMVDDAYYISIKEETETENYNLHFIKVLNEKVMFDKVIYANVKGTIVDFVVNKKEIVLLVEKENENTYQDIHMVYLNLDGTVKLDKKYSGPKVEYAQKILEDEDNYYILFTTISTSINGALIDIKFSGVVCFVIDRATRNVRGYTWYSYPRDSFFVDAVLRNGKLLVLSNYFDSSVTLKKYEIHEIDIEKIEVTYIYYLMHSLTEIPFKMVVDVDNNLYVATKEKNAGHLYKITTDYKNIYMGKYSYDECDNATITDFYITDTKEMIFLYNLIDTSKTDQYGYLYQVIKDGNLKTEILNYTSVSMVDSLVSDNQICFFNDNIVTINKIYFATFTDLCQNLKVKSATDFKEPTLFVDGKKICLDENKSSYAYDLEMFGTYDALYYFTTSHLDVITYGLIYVEPVVNLKSNEIYDINTNLEFNGKGILNDYNIENNYQLQIEGDYNLVVVGKDNEKILLNFKVEKNSDQNEKLLSDEINLTTKETYDETYNTISISNNIEKENLKKEKTSNAWLIIIPFIGFTILIFTIVKKRG